MLPPAPLPLCHAQHSHDLLARNLSAVVNSHHDDWLDGSADDAAFSRNLERFQAIWSALSARFASAPDELLAFEVYNEPHLNMTAPWLNRMNAAVLPLIRTHNPTRTVFLGGLEWMSPRWILQHPDGIAMLPPSGPVDAREAHTAR